MKHGHNGILAKSLFAVAMLALGACADNNTAPVSEVAASVAPANFLQLGNSVVFTVKNQGGITQEIGDHILYMPANAICDLASSGYGETTWNNTCKPMKGSITITATVFVGPEGQPYVDFQPAMRFAPDKPVYLFLRENRSSGNHLITVKYCNQVGNCVDESLTDPSLAPFRVEQYSLLGRRVKHFSGYVIAYEQCPADTVCDNGGLMLRKSGYMVASGESFVDVLRDGRFDPPNDDER